MGENDLRVMTDDSGWGWWGEQERRGAPALWRNGYERTSLVAQWVRICLPVQGTRVQSLIPEDSTCRGAAEPVRHSH